MKKLGILLLFCLFALSSFAQGKIPQHQVVDKKAQNYLNEARISFNQGDMRTGIEYLKMAVEVQPDYIDANTSLGHFYLEDKKFDLSVQAFTQVLKTDPDYDANVYIELAQAYFQLDKFDEATATINSLLNEHSKLLSDRLRKAAQHVLDNCAFSKDAMAHPVPFKPENLGPMVNTKSEEYFPVTTADEQYLYFTLQTSTRGMPQEDLAYCEWKNGAWTKAQILGPQINDPSSNEGAHTISPTGKYLLYTKCNTPDAIGSCDIFISKRNGDDWNEPKNIGPPINSGGYETQPSISGDGRDLYFVRGTREKGMEIYISHLNDTTGWSNPVSIGDVINTTGDEERPFIHPDNRTLYFASNGHPGLGLHDIFMSKKDDQGNWSKPVNLGYPINTKGDEMGLSLSADGKTAYYSSDKAGGQGGSDIYKFELYENARPDLVTYVKGHVFDAETKEPLAANIQLYNVESGLKITSLGSDAKNGSFLLTLPVGKDYMYNVAKDGYLFFSENFSLKDHKPTEPYKLEIYLNKIKEGVSIVLKNVFFETNKFALLPESKAELNKLADLLKKNPSLKIEVGGHTDNAGNDADNIKLSENRAKAVKDYLVSMGIDGARLTAKGYGKSKPIADNSTEAGRALNRRTEFTVTGR
jgi:outer membrane protein OmpA-like peptidoglycan-associated protein